MAGSRSKSKTSDAAGEVDEDPRFQPLEVGAPTADARCVESALSSLEEEITPTKRFFIRSHFAVPTVDPATWRLRIGGAVDAPLEITLDELRELPHRDVT